MHISLVFPILAIIICCSAAPIPQEEPEFSIIDLDDADLEGEVRRRNLGGPWEPEEAMAILNTAIDQISRYNSSRARRFTNEAKFILTLLTAQEEPLVEAQIEVDYDPDFIEDEEGVATGHTPSASTVRKILNMIDGTEGQKRRSVESVEKLYPWFHRNYVARFRSKLAGSYIDKVRAMNRHVYNAFSEARRKRQPVHGRMIQRWAKQYSSQINLTDFRASDSWLTSFKRRYGIVSRKVTNYIGRSELANVPTIAANILAFGGIYTNSSVPFDKSEIWNFDQTGFNYEPANLRTLSFKGERDTSLLLDSRNKSTHSYTVQPMVSRSVMLFGKFLIVLQEREGVFGPKVAAQVSDLERRFGNIEVYASVSGKLSAELINKLYNGTLSSAVKSIKERKMIEDEEPSVLIFADSWGGHSSPRQQAMLRDMGAKILKLPPSTTDRLQPLDVNFNRQLKIFYNRVIEEAFYQNITASVTSREGILNLQSLLHDQLSSPKYRDMLLYAWRNTDPNFNATSEMGTVPPRMVNHIQFDFDAAELCQRQDCRNHAFLKCSHCGRLICLNHFLERVCFHRQRAKRFAEEDPGAETCSAEGESEEGSCDVPQKEKIAKSISVEDVAKIADALSGTGGASGIAATGIGLAAILGTLHSNNQRSTTAQDIITTPAPRLEEFRSTRAPKARKKAARGRQRAPKLRLRL